MEQSFELAKKSEELYFSIFDITTNRDHYPARHQNRIVSVTKGLRFIGFHTYITNDGVIIRRLTSENKRQVKKRLRKNAKLVAEGRMSRKKFDKKYGSWKITPLTETATDLSKARTAS